MSELITEHFACKICHDSHFVSPSEVKDELTVCNGCWLRMRVWQRY